MAVKKNKFKEFPETGVDMELNPQLSKKSVEAIRQYQSDKVFFDKIVNHQVITDNYALYEGDCNMVMSGLRKESIDLSIYSPPFGGLYCYSSSDNDLSNCQNVDDFMKHYEYTVEHIARVTKPGRMTIVHCQDVPQKGNKLWDFPGEIIRLHEKHGFHYHDRHMVWKEPLRVAIRTRSLGLTHRQIVKDSTLCRTALADYILVFRKRGENKVPVAHPLGLLRYAGSNPPEKELYEKYKNWTNPQTNKLAHRIWQKYASAFWDDIRINKVLEFKKAKEKDDEKHCHPLQLDVIERCVTLWSNKGETILTPFMGVGSEVYGAVILGRKGIGIELKSSYFRQSVENLLTAKEISEDDFYDNSIFAGMDELEEIESEETELT